MSAVTVQPPAKPNEAVAAASVTLQNVSWETYERLLNDLAEQHVQMIYDEGTLTMMAPSFGHERDGRIVARLINAYAEIKDLPLAQCGGPTFRRSSLAKGLEPDDCFYIEHELAVRGVKDLDLEIHPPPDLAIEVEVSSLADRKLPIYAALGVPEVWRVSGERVRMFLLDAGEYGETSRSRNLPGLTPELVHHLIGLRAGLDDTSWIKRVREELSRSLP